MDGADIALPCVVGQDNLYPLISLIHIYDYKQNHVIIIVQEVTMNSLNPCKFFTNKFLTRFWLNLLYLKCLFFPWVKRFSFL